MSVLKLPSPCVAAAFRDKRSSCNISLKFLRAQADSTGHLRHRLLQRQVQLASERVQCHLCSIWIFSGIDVKCVPVFAERRRSRAAPTTRRKPEEFAYTCDAGYTMDGTPQGRSTGVYTSVPPVLPVDCGVPPRRNPTAVVKYSASVFRQHFVEKRSSCNISLEILRAQADCPCDLRHRLLH